MLKPRQYAFINFYVARSTKALSGKNPITTGYMSFTGMVKEIIDNKPFKKYIVEDFNGNIYEIPSKDMIGYSKSYCDLKLHSSLNRRKGMEW